jgi:predicted PurR-regulated permease PerM
VLLSSFFFYVEGEAILRELALLSPLPARYDREFGHKFKDVIDATFRGQLLTALAQGAATGIGLMIARVPGGFFWGAVAAVVSLLPMFGAAAVWVPATIYLFISASLHDRPYWPAIFLAVWGVLVVSTIDNVVRPWAMKGKAELPAIPLLFAVLGGMQAFGFIGLVIGPLVFSLLKTMIDIYKESFRIPVSDSDVA